MARERPDSTRSRPLTAARSNCGAEHPARLVDRRQGAPPRDSSGPWQVRICSANLLDDAAGADLRRQDLQPGHWSLDLRGGGDAGNAAVCSARRQCRREHLTMISLQDPLTGGSGQATPSRSWCPAQRDQPGRGDAAAGAAISARLGDRPAAAKTPGDRRRYLRARSGRGGRAIGRNRRAHRMSAGRSVACGIPGGGATPPPAI